jgi:hypothetical protein
MNNIQRQRGSALVGSVAIAAIAAMSLGVALVLNSSYNRSTFIKTDSEAALLMAESGINDELNRITTAIAGGKALAATAPIQASGAPYKGRRGEVKSATGTYWVYTSSDIDGTIPWNGTSSFFITSNALVNGSWRRVRIGGPKEQPFQSPFGTFAVFGFDSASSSSRANLGMTGNAVVQITGVIGTNGRVDGGAGTMTFTSGANYNVGAYSGTSHVQLVGSNVFEKSEKLVLPSVLQVIRQTIPVTADMTDTQVWTHLRTTNKNTAGIKQWKTGLASTASLSPSTVVSADFPPTGSSGAFTLTNNAGGGNLGRWQSKNLAPGSTTKRTLIFQPGDYYFESIALSDNVNTEIVIDTAGLTVEGGNPDRNPVRFFVNGSGSDSIELQVKQTDPTDSAGLRIYYGKSGGNISIVKPASASSSTDWITSLTVYAVTTSESGGNGTEITMIGSSSTGWLTVRGGLLADRVGFQQRCRVVSTGDNMVRRLDPILGVGYTGGYSDD